MTKETYEIIRGPYKGMRGEFKGYNGKYKVLTLSLPEEVLFESDSIRLVTEETEQVRSGDDR